VYNTCCCSAKIFKAEFIKRLIKAWISFVLLYSSLNDKTKKQTTTKEDVHDSWFLHQDINSGFPGY
jgi:hypothetical protein